MMFRILFDALRLDPLGLIPNCSSERMAKNFELIRSRSRFKDSRFFPRTVRFIAFFRNLVRATLSSDANAVPQLKDHAFFGLTQNQSLAIRPVVERLNAVSPGSGQLYSSLDMTWTLRPSFWWSLPFLPVLLVRMLQQRGYGRLSFRWALDEYWRSYGLYIVLRTWLKKNPIKSVTVSNDISLLPCVIRQAAQDQGITTFYIQHACVPEEWPPLQVDFALLDGTDAMEKYEVADRTRTTIALIGVPKFDAYRARIRPAGPVRTIGVCFSLADEMDRCLDLLDSVSRIPHLSIIVRPHMGMRDSDKSQLRAACDKYGYSYSSHSQEASFDFLGRLDGLISGTSAIVLEATLLNIPTWNFVLNPQDSDWYGFIKNGLTESTNNIEELVRWIGASQSEAETVRGRSARYCATVGTQFDGRSSELAADLILSQGKSRRYFVPNSDAEGILRPKSNSSVVVTL